LRRNSALNYVMPATGSRNRAYCFTCNNYTEESRDILAGLDEDGTTKFIIYQPERAPSTGTRHLQGYIVFSNPRTHAGVRVLLGPQFSLQVARGDCESNVAYCSKEESRDTDAEFGVIELGDRESALGTGAGSGSRTDLERIAKRIRDGATESDIAEDYPASYIMYTRGIRSFAQLKVPRRRDPPTVYWYWGPTGTGKTRSASEESPDAYWKSASHTWWDGYDGIADVIIDDYRCDFCKFSELLRILDRYPYQLQIKGGTQQLNAKRIYITAPRPPAEMWASRTEEDLGQLLRRITEIKYFGPPAEPIIIAN
jgi:hypothetical protein